MRHSLALIDRVHVWILALVLYMYRHRTYRAVASFILVAAVDRVVRLVAWQVFYSLFNVLLDEDIQELKVGLVVNFLKCVQLAIECVSVCDYS